MFQKLDVFRTAMAMARHAGQQQAYSAENIAHADTPGYRAKEMPDFASGLRDGLMGQRATRAAHLNGGTSRSAEGVERRQVLDPNGNTVSLEQEMVKSVRAKSQHDRALAIYRSNLNILRASLGRG
ncbi:FlgB family protein [Maliponia aquimaris]|uniref:Flagellar basal body rod protein FlgB n=1 Tax=Maliponia aquimaris TaxID=1673631 RepID=A0A238JNJ8_9RHOB|nr:FlgB family protein [Maliponia aquimaris]SMX32221.1 flagellar basal body rod protein FlgB [Maliponia aquimaris]